MSPFFTDRRPTPVVLRRLTLRMEAVPSLLKLRLLRDLRPQETRSPANFFVVVTDHRTGAPVTNLSESNFAIINHFSIPGYHVALATRSRWDSPTALR